MTGIPMEGRAFSAHGQFVHPIGNHMVQEVDAIESTFLTDGSSFLPMLRIVRWVDSIDLVKKALNPSAWWRVRIESPMFSNFNRLSFLGNGGSLCRQYI